MNEKTAVPRLPFIQALGLPWSALKLIAAQPGAIAINVIIMTGFMVMMSRPSWLVLGAPLFLVFAIGGLSWMQRTQATSTTVFPWGSLLRLSIGFYLLLLPFVLIILAIGLAVDGGKGGFLLLFALLPAIRYTSIEFLLWWSQFGDKAIIFAIVSLICLAPARVALDGQGARQAVWYSLRCWLRNPVATLVVALIALGVAGALALVEAFYWRHGAPGRLMLYAAMASASLILITVLTAFGQGLSRLARNDVTAGQPPGPSPVG